MKKGLPVILALFLIILPAVSAQVILTPTGDDNIISTDTVINISASPYTISDSNSNGVLIIDSDDVTLDCNGSILIGSGDGFTVVSQGFTNITIRNCNITGYDSAFRGNGYKIKILSNNLSYNTYGIVFPISSETSSDVSIIGNTIIGSDNTGALVFTSLQSLVFSDNLISGSTVAGALLNAFDNAVIQSNVITGNPSTGLFITFGNATELSSNTVTGSNDDIYLLNAEVLSRSSNTFGNLTSLWTFQANVTNGTDPLEGALIELYDSSGRKASLYEDTTGPDGNLSAATDLADYLENQTGTHDFNPYTLNVSKQGYYNSTQQITIDSEAIHQVSLSPSSFQEPTIDAYSIHPPLVFAGDDILIGVNASDDQGISEVRASITYPNSTIAPGITLLNDGVVSWNAPVSGTYSYTITAEDTTSSTTNVTGSFTAGTPFDLTLNITDFNGTGFSIDLDIYPTGTSYRIFRGHESDGQFDITLADHAYDLDFLAFDDTFELTLRNVTITSSFNKSLDLLEYYGTEGYDFIANVETDYQMEDALIRLYYSDFSLSNETMASAYVCSDWDLDGSFCDDDWEQIDDFTNNEDDEYLEFTVSGFSAFALREGTYCGDGWCGPGETKSSCSEDCYCNQGETRSCNIAHYGICASGTETCTDNIWSGCPSARLETCNRQDDDCDNTIDNVNGGSSLSATKCGCYDDATPSTEQCNGIDDDCDGIIDNNADCCTTGQTRDCGPSTEEGACQKGTSSCIGGTWGACQGAVSPANEVCGDIIDNDCDGQVDEDCIVDPCGQGEISSRCLCEGSSRTAGYCCSDTYFTEACPEFPYWWLLIAAGVAILVVLVILLLRFRKEGKELTWEELMNKYRPPGQPPAPPG